MLQVSEDGSAVALRWSDGDREAMIEFASPRFRYRDPSDPYLAADDMVEYTVRLSGNGLTAEALVLSLDTAGHGLPAFLEELAEEFRGWDGTRTWENADHDLGVGATWTARVRDPALVDHAEHLRPVDRVGGGRRRGWSRDVRTCSRPVGLLCYLKTTPSACTHIGMTAHSPSAAMSGHLLG